MEIDWESDLGSDAESQAEVSNSRDFLQHAHDTSCLLSELFFTHIGHQKESASESASPLKVTAITDLGYPGIIVPPA